MRTKRNKVHHVAPKLTKIHEKKTLFILEFVLVFDISAACTIFQRKYKKIIMIFPSGEIVGMAYTCNFSAKTNYW